MCLGNLHTGSSFLSFWQKDITRSFSHLHRQPYTPSLSRFNRYRQSTTGQAPTEHHRTTDLASFRLDLQQCYTWQWFLLLFCRLSYIYIYSFLHLYTRIILPHTLESIFCDVRVCCATWDASRLNFQRYVYSQEARLTCVDPSRERNTTITCVREWVCVCVCGRARV